MNETTEKKKSQKKFAVYEWTIENFRSWGFSGVLRSPNRPNRLQFELIRTSHTDKRSGKLWLNIPKVPGNAEGDFSLIGPDGLIIWTKRMNKKDGRNNLPICDVLPVNFSDLVALIRKNEAVHGDRLTLRFRFEDKVGNVFHSMHSIFEGKTMSVKISLASILNGQPEPSALRRVFTAEYPLSDGTTEKVKVIVNESPSSKIELMLVSDSSNETISFLTHMSVLHSDGSVIRTEDREEEISKGQIWTFSDSLTKNEVVLEGLSILLRLTVFPSTELKQLYTLTHHSPFVTEVTMTSPNEPVDVLLKDFLSLHRNKDFSDLQLTSEGVSFPVHKSILSARSPVFKSMLSSSDMKEVDIADLDAPTLARFLTFLYSGTVNDLQSDAAIKLYYAADEYQVPTLKTACVSFLSAVLSTNNVCDVLSLADQHGDERLLSATHSFILKNYNKVLESEEWEGLMKRDSLLVSKTLTDFARRGHTKSAKVAKN